MNINVFGDVKNPDSYKLNPGTTYFDLLEVSGGVSRGRTPKFVQVGGPLGRVLPLEGMVEEVSLAGEKHSLLMFMSDRSCPVNFTRFLVRYVKREMGLKPPVILKLEELFEKFTSKEVVRDYMVEDFFKYLEELRGHQEKPLKKLGVLIEELYKLFKDEFEEHIREGFCRNLICRRTFDARCMSTCPAHVNIPGYIHLIRNNRELEAYQLMRRENPLPFICGLICARPCETMCMRGELDSPVAIRGIKRYLADKYNDVVVEDRLDSKGKRVAVIGAGPAGLTASYYLGKTGYDVDLYEKNDLPGGYLATGIPEYRLPQEVIDREVRHLTDVGVNITYNFQVTREKYLELSDKYDGIVVNTGTVVGNKIGPDAVNVFTSVEILRDVKYLKKKLSLGRVVVIGGGDVALDAARTSRRLGSEVEVITLERNCHEMPASKEEVQGGVEEGVVLRNGWRSKEFIREGDRVSKIVFEKVSQVFDRFGKFSIEVTDETMEVECDTLIFAIGQSPDSAYLEGIETDRRGFVVAGADLATTDPKVFVCGDAYKPGIAVKAVAEGKKAAESLDRYLGGEGLYKGKEIDLGDEKPLNWDIWKIPREEEEELSVQERRDKFKLITKTMERESVLRECDRCMRCDINTKESDIC